MEAHRLAEERSLAMHAEVARRLEEHPELVERARARVAEWRRTGAIHPKYGAEWQEILSRPIAEICAVLTGTGERERALRQCTPFAGAIDQPTRWRIWKEVGERFAKVDS